MNQSLCRPRRLFKLIAVTLQAVALLLAFELSGLAHVTGDLAEQVLTGTVHHDDDDCEDQSGEHCPPGCPTCHCAHTTTGALAGWFDSASFAYAAPLAEITQFSHRPDAAPSPDLPTLFRPPRSARVA